MLSVQGLAVDFIDDEVAKEDGLILSEYQQPLVLWLLPGEVQLNNGVSSFSAKPNLLSIQRVDHANKIIFYKLENGAL